VSRPLKTDDEISTIAFRVNVRPRASTAVSGEWMTDAEKILTDARAWFDEAGFTTLVDGGHSLVVARPQGTAR
jgi:hypothetical protein